MKNSLETNSSCSEVYHAKAKEAAESILAGEYEVPYEVHLLARAYLNSEEKLALETNRVAALDKELCEFDKKIVAIMKGEY